MDNSLPIVFLLVYLMVGVAIVVGVEIFTPDDEGDL